MTIIEFVKAKSKTVKRFSVAFTKWFCIAVIIGIVGGIIGSLFHLAVIATTNFRGEHNFLIYFLPLGGLLIVFLYKFTKTDENTGTNLIISSIRTNTNVPFLVAPLIFISTCITHLFGGSAGREGAALQLGGSIGAKFGDIFKLDEKNMSVVIICGMSAVFAALFGTPLTACFFAMEVISVGIIYYVALVPALASSLIAYKISLMFKLAPTSFDIKNFIPSLNLVTALQVGALAAICAAVSIIFCMVMKYSHEKLDKLIPNSYIKIAVGGAVIILLTLIVGNYDYNGAGEYVISKALLNGNSNWYDCILKIIFTAITISAGFKGGEIVPTFFIGATLGCTIAPLLGMSCQFGAAIGLIALFCGAVNCPIASIILSIEMFGASGLLLFAIASGVSYMLSGYYGLYSSQKIVYSKLRPEFININAK